MARYNNLKIDETLLLLQGEKGDKGDKGEKGDKGDKGEKGDVSLEQYLKLCGKYEQTLTFNQYVEPASGRVYSHTQAFYASDFIKVYGDKLYLYGTCSASTNRSGAGYAFYDSTQKYISGGENISVENALTEIDIPEGAVYFRYTNKGNANSCVAYDDSLLNLFESIKEIKGDHFVSTTDMLGKYEFEMVEGTYVTNNYGIEYKHASYYASPYIRIFGGKLYLYGTCGPTADLAGYAFYDESFAFISGGRNTSAYLHMTEIDIPKGAVYFRFSNTKATSGQVYLFSGNIINELVNEKKSLNEQKWKYALDKVCCLGDSLTSGAYYANGWTGKSISQNYPYFLSRMLNTSVDNKGVSGWSPSDWWTNNDNVRAITWSNYNTVILWLGTNRGLTDTLDADVNAFSNYNDYTTSETGCYCKIIEYIKEQNSDCLIAIGTVFASSGDKDVTNSVISKIAEKYGLLVVDFSGFGTDKEPYHVNISNVHFGKVGNIAIADHIIETLKNYIADDLNRGEYGISERDN